MESFGVEQLYPPFESFMHHHLLPCDLLWEIWLLVHGPLLLLRAVWSILLGKGCYLRANLHLQPMIGETTDVVAVDLQSAPSIPEYKASD